MEWIKKSGLFIPSQKLELPKHHSLADWDFRAGLVYALDNVIFISAPSSIRITPTIANTIHVLSLNRDAACITLPEGRIETQWRVTGIGTGAGCGVIFRNQGALGVIDEANTYYVNFFSESAVVAKTVGGGVTALGSWALGHVTNTWYRERVTWWNEAPVLLIRYEYWDGANWVIPAADITDPAPDFGASATNRVGLGSLNIGANAYYDDTMIYGPA